MKVKENKWDRKLNDSLDQQYMSLEFSDGMVAQVKFEDEGVVLDVFTEGGDVIATTYRFYNELKINKHRI